MSRSRMHRRLPLLVLLSATFVVGTGCESRDRDQDINVVITTATEGGTYIEVGRQLARILTEYPVEGIGRVTAVPSPGSNENINRLLEGRAQLALVFAPTLATHPERGELGVLLVLYHDIWQVVVHKSTGIKKIQRLGDLTSPRIFVGPEKSATRSGATKMLA